MSRSIFSISGIAFRRSHFFPCAEKSVSFWIKGEQNSRSGSYMDVEGTFTKYERLEQCNCSGAAGT